MPKGILDLIMLATIAAAGIINFGWLSGLALTCAVYMLMPYDYSSRRL